MIINLPPAPFFKIMWTGNYSLSWNGLMCTKSLTILCIYGSVRGVNYTVFLCYHRMFVLSQKVTSNTGNSIVSRGQTLFSRRGVIAFSISAPHAYTASDKRPVKISGVATQD